MSEIKTEIKQNPDGNYTITDAHSTADVVRWLLTQDSKETILYLLGDKRPWVGLTNTEFGEIYDSYGTVDGAMEAVEARLKELNT